MSSTITEHAPSSIIIGTPGAKRIDMNRAECLAFAWVFEHAAADLDLLGRAHLGDKIRLAAAKWRFTAETR